MVTSNISEKKIYLLINTILNKIGFFMKLSLNNSNNIVVKLINLPLWQQVTIGLILGIITALFLGDKAEYLKPLGTIFINLIKTVIIPLVFFAIISSVVSFGNASNISRIAVKSTIAFLSTSVLAVSIGIIVTILFKPGVGLDLNILSFRNEQTNKAVPTIEQVITGIVPSNIFASLVEGNILQIIIFAFFTGISLNLLGNKANDVIKICHQLYQLSLKMIELIIKLAPIGVFGYISWSIGTQGFQSLFSMFNLIGTILIACLIQYLIFGILILVFARINRIPFYIKMIEPQLLALSTSSSKATLSTTMQTLNSKLGVSRNSTNFILPLGSSINMDGGAIYLGVCLIFFAQVVGIDLTIYDFCILMFMCTLGSIGAAGIPSGILLFLGMTFSSIGLPIEAVAFVAGIDRFIDMITTAINVTGDACITLIIDKTEGSLDENKYMKQCHHYDGYKLKHGEI